LNRKDAKAQKKSRVTKTCRVVVIGRSHCNLKHCVFFTIIHLAPREASMQFDGKVALVTGAAQGIGSAIAKQLLTAGAQVVLNDRTPEQVEAGIQRIGGSQPRLFGAAADVTNRAEVEAMIAAAIAHFGRLDIVVNNAGLYPVTPVLDMTESEWDTVLGVNLKGTFLMSQAVIPYFKKKRKGVIVNISSTYGNVSPNKSIYGNSGINAPVAYSSSKAAIINLTRYIATHMAEYGIRANVLSLGGVYNNQSEDFLKNYKALTPLERMASAEEYQGAILFLLGDASSYMTGSNVVIDGGWTSW
jgi:NAD(P)-dependent dehydrogenase (short-subunit alcohol dehydrogenase family)